MTPQEARYTALSLHRRMEEVAGMIKRDPALVRVATDANGDKVAFWFTQGREIAFNLSAAQRKIKDLVALHGSDIGKSRSGKTITLDLPI